MTVERAWGLGAGGGRAGPLPSSPCPGARTDGQEERTGLLWSQSANTG